MDAFGHFVDDLARQEVAAAGGQPQTGEPWAFASDPRTMRLVHRIRDEVLATGVLIAVSAGIANALEQGRASPGRRGLAVYAPVEATYFQTMMTRLMTGEVPSALGHALQLYGARLALAQRLSRTIAEDADRPGETPLVDAELVADAWRRTCRATLDLIAALTAADAAVTASAPGESADPTRNLLAMAEAGHSPCLDPDGRVTIPGWAERRREPRFAIRLAATATADGRACAVTIRDVSATGLGLDGATGMNAGARVVVRLPGDRSLTGLVAWNDGDRVGVQLDQRLAAADPLLTGR